MNLNIINFDKFNKDNRCLKFFYIFLFSFLYCLINITSKKKRAVKPVLKDLNLSNRNLKQ